MFDNYEDYNVAQVILFVDLLGARRKWQEGGVERATKAFTSFSRLVIAAFRSISATSIVRGGVETDSAMFIFDSAVSALNAARELYKIAFQKNIEKSGKRLWLRGSLVLDGDNEFIRKETSGQRELSNVKFVSYSKQALDAISIEKSGFKGMRLLIRKNVIDESLRESMKISCDTHFFQPLRKLRHSSYPQESKSEFVDYLWMAEKNENEWNEMVLCMMDRMRYAAKFPEEFAQAASTQVVFHECAALRQSVISRAKRRMALASSSSSIAP